MKAKVPYLDAIWRVRDSIALPEGVPPDAAFDRLSPLFATRGTSIDLGGGTLTYSKENPAAQDKLATFTSGTLRLETSGGRARLAYDVGSAALLLCFLAPLLFLAFAQLAVLANTLDPPEPEQARGRDGASEQAEDAREPADLHWIDQMLGAPAPEAEDDEEKTGEDEDEEDEGKHSPTPGYVLAGIFAVVYLAGRFLEPWLLKRTFRAALEGELDAIGDPGTGHETPADIAQPLREEGIGWGEDPGKPQG